MGCESLFRLRFGPSLRIKDSYIEVCDSVDNPDIVVCYPIDNSNTSVKLLRDFLFRIACEKHDGGKGEQGKEYFLHNAY